MKVYVPDLTLLETVIFSVDVPEPVIDVGLRLAVNPVGALESESATALLNPLRAFTVTVEVPEDPLPMFNDVGDVVIEKSGFVTCTVIVAL